MSDSFIDWLSSLPAEIERPASRKTEQRFPCGQCAGTGKWSGGTNRHGNSNCLACRGKGYFTTSPEFRAKAKARAMQKANEREDALRRAVKDFSEAQPEMFADLMRARTEFTASLRDQLLAKGSLSDRQIDAWHRGNEKRKAAMAERMAEVDLTPIRDMFDAAQASGYKKPVYRAEGLKLTLAGSMSSNAGCLYVVEIEDDSYQGKVDGILFKGVFGGRKDVAERLRVIAQNPLDAAVRYGRKTGTCSCCGRELTNHASIEAGIGPICAQKWGFM